jgi:hypothetical protein
MACSIAYRNRLLRRHLTEKHSTFFGDLTNTLDVGVCKRRWPRQSHCIHEIDCEERFSRVTLTADWALSPGCWATPCVVRMYAAVWHLTYFVPMDSVSIVNNLIEIVFEHGLHIGPWPYCGVYNAPPRDPMARAQPALYHVIHVNSSASTLWCGEIRIFHGTIRKLCL